jgi:metallo-beta-lactamase class B
VLELLAPDVWLTAHPEMADLDGKRDRATRAGTAAWVDPGGYRRMLIEKRAKLEETIDRERGGSDGR